ncbi:MAG TPA: hypothetical protein VNV65_02500 [Candidatus Solibacter sp.]|jgi:hypothetical protein|nr:hypothetical protein [Candidatus Solibacter sp.]
MISISKNLRSAAIVAAAFATLAGTGALAQSATGAAHANPKSTTAPKATPSPEASEKPDVTTSETPEVQSSADANDAHGDCVSAVAKSDATATAHGHTNHGAAVSHAARVTCAKK